MYYSEVQIVILLYGISLVNGVFHFRHLFEHNQSVSFNKSTLRSDPTHWIEQRVDHFNYRDRRTWNQKYYKLMRSWKPEGPILLSLGGEGSLKLRNLKNEYWDDYGGEFQSLIGQIAVETGAAYFMLEHRYYGESQPFGEMEPTTEDLAFLTSRQALADAAHLLITIKKTPEFQNSKVIVVGGSYAGNLAAWMKLLYPELIDAVLASSAPVLAKKDFNEYLETVTDTFRTYGSQDCVNKITERFNTLHELFQRPEAVEKLKVDNFICDDVDMSVPENQQLFFYEIMGAYQAAAQYGTPANVSLTCQDFNVFYTDRMLATFWNDKNNCSAYDFNKWIHTPSERSWWYQTCTEFGYFQSTSSSKHMFGKTLPVDFFYKTCRIMFGEEFNEERVDQGVINTNRIYGGLTPNVKNVVFVNVDMDPWHRLGIMQDLSADAPAIVIKGSSHCHDVHPDPSDTDSIKEARERIKNLLKKWIGGA